MKTFMFFEAQEGGMGQIEVNTKKDLEYIPYWMKRGCVGDDVAMLSWMETAEVGTAHDHRVGVMVRMKDRKEE